VAASKYVDGLPLYRLSKHFERIGAQLPWNVPRESLIL
jgi:hypothetical protein